MRYRIELEFDGDEDDYVEEGNLPHVYIVDSLNEKAVLEVFDIPTCNLGGKPVFNPEIEGEYNWDGPWSENVEDWEPGEFAKQMVYLLNEYA